MILYFVLSVLRHILYLLLDVCCLMFAEHTAHDFLRLGRRILMRGDLLRADISSFFLWWLIVRRGFAIVVGLGCLSCSFKLFSLLGF